MPKSNWPRIPWTRHVYQTILGDSVVWTGARRIPNPGEWYLMYVDSEWIGQMAGIDETENQFIAEEQHVST